MDRAVVAARRELLEKGRMRINGAERLDATFALPQLYAAESVDELVDEHRPPVRPERGVATLADSTAAVTAIRAIASPTPIADFTTLVTDWLKTKASPADVNHESKHIFTMRINLTRILVSTFIALGIAVPGAVCPATVRGYFL